MISVFWSGKSCVSVRHNKIGSSLISTACLKNDLMFNNVTVIESSDNPE